MAHRILVCGTGTGVGKTHLCVALIEGLGSDGRSVAGVKPVESGVGVGVTDSEMLAERSTFHVKHPPPYAFSAPVAPLLAASAENTTIALDVIAQWLDSCAAPYIVIETAGGLFTPLTPSATNADLLHLARADQILLVASDRLGALHDVAACLYALSHLSPHVPPLQVVLQTPATTDVSTGSNASALRALHPTLGPIPVIPFAGPTTPAVQQAIRPLLPAR